MAYADVLKDIERCVALKKPNRLPVFAMTEEFDVRMAGMVYNEFNRDAKLMAKCTIDSIKKYDYDWAWLQIDDCIEFECLGVGVKGQGNILPATCDYLPGTFATLRGLKKPNPKKDGRMPVLLEAIKRVKDEFGDTVCVTGRVAAPFSSAALLYGLDETMMMMYDDPELLRETIKFFIDFQIEWGIEQAKAGADALWVGDCNASGHLISADQYREFALDGVKQCCKAYDEMHCWSFYHASEHSVPHIQAQIEGGISALSVGPGVDISVAKQAVRDKICLIGNIDPILYLFEKDADSVYEESKRIARIGCEGGGYIFNSGEMIPRDTPEPNILAMMRGAREIGC